MEVETKNTKNNDDYTSSGNISSNSSSDRRTNRNWKLKTNNKYQRNGFSMQRKAKQHRTSTKKLAFCLGFTCAHRLHCLQTITIKQYDNIIHFTRLRLVNISVHGFSCSSFSLCTRCVCVVCFLKALVLLTNRQLNLQIKYCILSVYRIESLVLTSYCI